MPLLAASFLRACFNNRPAASKSSDIRRGRRRRRYIFGRAAGAALVALLLVGAARAQDDVPMRAMKDELTRSLAQLQLQQLDKPYYLAYRMEDVSQTTVSATLGSLTQAQPTRERVIAVEVRVGDYALDNTNYFSLRSLGGLAGMLSSMARAPLDDNYQQIRREFWLATDRQYKRALENLSAKRAALELRKRAADLPDFSKENAVTETTAPSISQPGLEELKALVRELSAVFRDAPEIYNSSVDLQYRADYVRYINSEGSMFTRSEPVFKLRISAQTQATDGSPVTDSWNIFGRTLADLPAKSVLLDRTRALAGRLSKLRSAVSVENYNGPVLFEGDAAGEVFLQQFAGGLLAVRTPVSDDSSFDTIFNQLMGQLGGASFADKIGGRVLPEFLSVSDKPLLSEYHGASLLGTSKIDDDAVKTRETVLVDHGVLKALLATRVPVRAAPHSTGSRRGWGAVPSNLVVTAEKPMNAGQLRQELLGRAKERGLDYAIVVRRLGGGGAASLMRTAMRMAQQGGAGSGAMAEVYKVYPDGREELVQGLEIGEMTAATFKDIVAAGDTPVVFTDEFVPRLGALLGGSLSSSSELPAVSCITPALLFDEVSLAKSQGPFPGPPVSPSPLAKQ